MLFYRYENNQDHTGTKITEYKFFLLRETKCGYWICPDYMFSYTEPDHERMKKWISKTTRKRYAYPTKEEAKNSFIARKKMECLLLMHRLKCSKNSLRQLDIEPPKENGFEMNLFNRDIDRDY
jgi:hypothetical protein